LECTVPPSSPLRHGAGHLNRVWWDGANTGCTDLAQHTRIANESECASGAAIATLDHPGIILRKISFASNPAILFGFKAVHSGMHEPSEFAFSESEKM
jgi:hypothetical protein